MMSPNNESYFDYLYLRQTRILGPYVLFQAGCHVCKPDCPVPSHEQEIYELIYIQSGAGTVTVNDTVFKAQSGNLFFCRTGELHSIESAPDDQLRFMYIGFNFTVPSSSPYTELREFLDSTREHVINRAARLATPFEYLIAETAEENDISSIMLQSYFSQLLFTVFRLFDNKRNRRFLFGAGSDAEKRLVKDITNYIDANINDIKNLSFLETVFGYSGTYINKKFIQVTGESVNAYFQAKKFNLAKEYLRSGKSVTFTAKQTHYTSIHAFSRAFKAYTGVSPQRFSRGEATLENSDASEP